MPIEEIDQLMERHTAEPAKREAQHKLAFEFVELVHGTQEATQTQEAHKSLFTKPSSQKPIEVDGKLVEGAQGTANTELSALSRAALLQRASTSVLLPVSKVLNRNIAHVLHYAGLTSTRTEARNKIMQNGVYYGFDFAPVRSHNMAVTKDILDEDGTLLVLRTGKWNVKVIRLVSWEEFDRLSDDKTKRDLERKVKGEGA
jgi:tyrosyl-tRNA synthetase